MDGKAGRRSQYQLMKDTEIRSYQESKQLVLNRNI